MILLGRGRVESGGEEVGAALLHAQARAQVPAYHSLWLRVGPRMPSVTVGGVRSRGSGAVNVSCFANKKCYTSATILRLILLTFG